MIMMVGYKEQHHHFIFGYGSLICPKSRKISAPSLSEADAEAIPVLVTNWKRSWSARAPNHDYGWKGQTYMGIQQEEGKCCNGVLIRVNETQLKQLDIREEGYDRVHIDLSEIHHVPTDNEANFINKSFLSLFVIMFGYIGTEIIIFHPIPCFQSSNPMSILYCVDVSVLVRSLHDCF